MLSKVKKDRLLELYNDLYETEDFFDAVAEEELAAEEAALRAQEAAGPPPCVGICVSGGCLVVPVMSFANDGGASPPPSVTPIRTCRGGAGSGGGGGSGCRTTRCEFV